MKQFLKTVLFYMAIIVVLLFLFEWLFTHSYYNPKHPRSKVSWMMSMDNKDTLDYALFGSSRCVHSVNPQIINKAFATNGINLAYQAGNPLEVKLSLKTLLKKRHVKRIFVQADYSYDQHGPHKLAEIVWMPFLKEDYVYNEYKIYGNKYTYLKNIPFYRYMKYDGKIGFRDLFLNYAKESNVTHNQGYVPIQGTMKYNLMNSSKPKPIENPHLKEVIAICKEKGIEIDFFTAPMYAFDGDNSTLKNMLPNYKDFTSVVKDPKKFQDNTHVNDKGATVFTEIFMNYYFSNSTP